MGHAYMSAPQNLCPPPLAGHGDLSGSGPGCQGPGPGGAEALPGGFLHHSLELLGEAQGVTQEAKTLGTIQLYRGLNLATINQVQEARTPCRSMTTSMGNTGTRQQKG